MGFGVALIRLLVAAVVTVWPAGFVNAADLLLFAASSMAEPSRALIEQFEARHGRQVNLSTAGTATLVRQLNAGAPADVLITADRAWMDAAIESGVVDPETVVVIA